MKGELSSTGIIFLIILVCVHVVSGQPSSLLFSRAWTDESLQERDEVAYNATNARTGARFLTENGHAYVRVIVGFKPLLNDNIMDVYFDYKGKQMKSEFDRTNAVTMTIPESEIDFLRGLDQVEWIEEDVSTYAQSETVPWGIKTIQGDDERVPSASLSISSCFSICLIDSGVMLSHQDMPFKLGESYVEGASFGTSTDEAWYEPSEGHGKK